MRSFLVAVAFLTIIPIRFRELPSATDVARSRYWYPAVGLLLGALLGVWTWLVGQFTSPMIGAFLVLVAWVGLTGALHLDGVADLCDGLFGGHTPEERLKIMKDPHVGTFGVLGVVLVLLGKFAMLQGVIGRSVDAPWLVGAAALVSRSTVCLMAYLGRYPRAEGTGKLLIETMDLRTVVLCVALASVAILACPISGTVALSSIGVASAAFALLAMLCQRRLGGITGDCLGAGIELVEVTALLVAAV